MMEHCGGKIIATTRMPVSKPSRNVPFKCNSHICIPLNHHLSLTLSKLSFGLNSKSLSASHRFISLTLNDATTMSWLGGGTFGNTLVLVPAHVSQVGDEYLNVVRATIDFAEDISLTSEVRPCYAEGEDTLPFGP